MTYIILKYILLGLTTLLAITFTISPIVSPALIGFCVLFIIKLLDLAFVPQSVLIGWGAITAITMVIDFMQPEAIKKATNGTVYISIGSMTGMAAGFSSLSPITPTWSVIGAAVGALFGAMVYARTSGGSQLCFPSGRFWRYTAAKGFPIAVTWSLLAIALFTWLISNHPQLFVA